MTIAFLDVELCDCVGTAGDRRMLLLFTFVLLGPP
jgi:hypothetical protein